MSAATVNARRLEEWRATGHAYKLIAALMAEWAKEQERGSVLPLNGHFAEDLPIVVGPGPYKRAKRFLVSQGVLRGGDGDPYTVA